MDDQILMDSAVPVNIKFMPAQIEIVLSGLHELKYRIAQPLITSIINQVKEQAVKPKDSEGEPAK